LVREISTPGITALDWSVTTPWSVDSCAQLRPVTSTDARVEVSAARTKDRYTEEQPVDMFSPPAPSELLHFRALGLRPPIE
jgi:hypothetical protein